MSQGQDGEGGFSQICEKDDLVCQAIVAQSQIHSSQGLIMELTKDQGSFTKKVSTTASYFVPKPGI